MQLRFCDVRLGHNGVLTIRDASGQSQRFTQEQIDSWSGLSAPCSGASCPGWQMIDNNPATAAIVAGTALYQLHNTGRIWKAIGAPCTGASCRGWQLFDNNPASIAIYADGAQFYQLHNSGRVWKSTGSPCSGASCPGWQLFDNNAATGRVAAAGGRL